MALTEAEQISDIAFGFMGSKALFAALHVGVFTALSDAPQTPEALGPKIGLHPERCRTLLTALAGLGLVTVEADRFANSPAADAFLVKGRKYDFGDYLRLQVDRQMYRLLDQIDLALKDALPADATASYADWFADPEAAQVYSESQHAGSLGPARSLAKAVDLGAAERLLDVGGGTGAMAITLCEAFPTLSATIVDFPNVARLGAVKVAEAGLSDRIAYLPGDALTADWPEAQGAILMSYLFSGVPEGAHERLIARAVAHLAPGGRLMIHDFMVRADRTGPKNAALWQLQHTAFTPKARSIDDGWLAERLRAAGLEEITVQPLIPGMTMLADARKPLG